MTDSAQGGDQTKENVGMKEAITEELDVDSDKTKEKQQAESTDPKGEDQEAAGEETADQAGKGKKEEDTKQEEDQDPEKTDQVKWGHQANETKEAVAKKWGVDYDKTKTCTCSKGWPGHADLAWSELACVDCQDAKLTYNGVVFSKATAKVLFVKTASKVHFRGWLAFVGVNEDNRPAVCAVGLGKKKPGQPTVFVYDTKRNDGLPSIQGKSKWPDVWKAKETYEFTNHDMAQAKERFFGTVQER
jgi:hypothetical protein